LVNIVKCTACLILLQRALRGFAARPFSETSLTNPPGLINDDIVDLIPALRAFARTMYPKASDADDLVQTTLTRAIANVDHFKPDADLKAWLFSIMRYTFARAQREPRIPQLLLRAATPGTVTAIAGPDRARRSLH